MNETQGILSCNIKYLRKKKGFNQEQLAKALSIKRSNIAAYEAKNVEPRLRIILEMANLFDIDLHQFLEQKLNDQTELSHYNSDYDSEIKSFKSSVIDSDINLEDFVQKSTKIKKILVGLKSFHLFRRGSLTDKTSEQENILSDIDNFIMLMEHLIMHNEKLVKALATNRE